MEIKKLIRTIPDYPKPGVMFRDITTLLKDPLGLNLVIKSLCERYANIKIDKIAGIESRGFIIGSPLSYELGLGFIPIRKHGKLPAKTLGHDYDLEYGVDRIEIHVDAIQTGERILLVDDLIATGGTAEAGVKLIQNCGGILVECAFVVELPELGGKNRLEKIGTTAYSLTEFYGDENT